MPDSTSFFGDAPADDSQEFDRYQRYLLDTDGQGKKPYTRSTTLAKTLEDTYHLSQWNARRTARGVALRPDLVARAAVTPVSDKRSWTEIIEQAVIVAGDGNVQANRGTAFHQLHERVGSMTNEQYAAVPEDFRVTYELYRTELARNGITEVLTECTVANEKIGTAGKVDGMVRLADGRIVVADRKSGNVVTYPHSPSMQMAIYSHANVLFGEHGEPLPMPKDLDPSLGLVFDVTIKDSANGVDAAVHIYELDLEAGWYAALLATKVRRWRNRKDLLTPYQPEFKHIPATGAPEVYIPGSATVVAQQLPISQELAAEAYPPCEHGVHPGASCGPCLAAETKAHPEWGVTAAQVANGEHTQLADKIRQAAELALSSPNPEAVAAGERLLSREAEAKQAAAMAELDNEQPSQPAGPTHGSDTERLLTLYKTKPKLQAAARQVDPQMNVARQRANLAADMVSHPNWPSKRAEVLGLTEPMPPEGVAAQEAIDGNTWMPTADEVAQATPPGTEAQLLGNAPADNPYGGEPPAADPPSAPLSAEDRYIQQVAACDSKQAIGAVWSAAQAEGVEWTARLHQAASARIATFGS